MPPTVTREHPRDAVAAERMTTTNGRLPRKARLAWGLQREGKGNSTERTILRKTDSQRREHKKHEAPDLDIVVSWRKTHLIDWIAKNELMIADI